MILGNRSHNNALAGQLDPESQLVMFGNDASVLV